MSGPADLEARVYADRAHQLANELQAKEMELESAREALRASEREVDRLRDLLAQIAALSSRRGEA